MSSEAPRLLTLEEIRYITRPQLEFKLFELQEYLRKLQAIMGAPDAQS